MGQDRMLRASMRTSEKVNSWPIPLRFFWSQVWGYCDDYGRGLRDARLIVADTFPMDDEVTAETVERWMCALELAGVIRVYEVVGKRYFECVNWDEHQPLRHKRKSYIPAPPAGFAKNSAEVQKGANQREREREIEREGGNAERAPHCKLHLWGTVDPCRACGDARRAFDAAVKAEKAKPTPLPPRREEGMCVAHKDYPLPCLRCADEVAS